MCERRKVGRLLMKGESKEFTVINNTVLFKFNFFKDFFITFNQRKKHIICDFALKFDSFFFA